MILNDIFDYNITISFKRLLMVKSYDFRLVSVNSFLSAQYWLLIADFVTFCGVSLRKLHPNNWKTKCVFAEVTI